MPMLCSRFKAVQCSNVKALLLTAGAYAWVQHAVTRQCSHAPPECFDRNTHVHDTISAAAPTQALALVFSVRFREEQMSEI